MEKICKGCNESKCTSQFYINKARPDGLNTHCKKCILERQRKYNKKYKIEKQKELDEFGYLDLTGGNRKAIWCQTYFFLENLGYNASSDIHSQFIEKHPGLVYKPRPKKNRKTFTYEECVNYKQKNPHLF